MFEGPKLIVKVLDEIHAVLRFSQYSSTLRENVTRFFTNSNPLPLLPEVHLCFRLLTGTAAECRLILVDCPGVSDPVASQLQDGKSAALIDTAMSNAVATLLTNVARSCTSRSLCVVSDASRVWDEGPLAKWVEGVCYALDLLESRTHFLFIQEN